MHHALLSTKPLKFASFTIVLIALLLLTAQSAAAVQSDDFYSAELDTTLWDVVDPLGDATLRMSGTNLLIRVPDRVAHGLWTTDNRAPRLLQSVTDTDFEIEAKFDSRPAFRYQIQGIVIQEDEDTYLRFDVHHDGTNPRIFAGWVNGINPPSIYINQALADIPAYLKITRTGSLFEYEYSSDGTTWVTAGSFTRGMIVDQVGFFAANSNPIELDTPPFVANIDYFFNTATPIDPEDNGEPSAPTLPVVDLWYGDQQDFGHMGVPQQWVNLVGTVWDADDIAVLSYQINGSPTFPLTIGPDDYRLVAAGDFNIEIDYADLTPGPNDIVITAVDTVGEQTDHIVTVNYTGGVTWAIPYTAGFTSASEVTDVVHVVDGRWHVTGEGARTDTTATGYDRYLVLGDRTWPPDYEVTVPLTIHEWNIGGTARVGVAIGWQGHTGEQQPRFSKRYEAQARILDFPSNPTLQLKDTSGIRAQTGVTVAEGIRYMLKMRSLTLGAGLARVDVKFWEDGSPEPEDYNLTYDFAGQEGSIALMARYADVTFGDVSVTPLFPNVHTLTTNTVGNGTIDRNPNYTLYPDSTVILLTAVPDSGYAFLGWSDGLSGRTNPDTVVIRNDTTVTATFVEGIKSDDFYGPELNTSLWEFIDPVGDATLTMTGTNLTVYIPGGIKHHLTTTGNTTARIMQDSPDTDFDVVAKFGSRGAFTYQGQGILVQEDEDTYLRFDFVFTSGGPRIFAGYFDAGVLTTLRNSALSEAPPYLRVERSENTWTMRYSMDGSDWTHSTTFDQLITVTEVGVFFSNTGAAGYWDAPAFVGNIDYFFNSAAPIAVEDNGAPTATTPPVVDLWYGDNQEFGNLGIPQRWVNIIGNVWDTDQISSLTYTLNGGSSHVLNMGPDGFRLVGVGDFNAEIDFNDLVPGINDVIITAVDTLGEQTDHLVTIDYTEGITWEIPYTADWASATQISDVAYPGDGRWTLNAEGVSNLPGGVGYDRFIVMGDYRWMTDYEVTLPMTIHDGNVGGITGLGLAIGWQGHVGAPLQGGQYVQPRLENRYQAIGWVRDFPDDPVLQLRDDEVTHGELGISVQADVCYILKMRSEYQGPGVAHVSLKIWEDGTAEPDVWQLSDDFASRDGSILLIAHHAAATFGDVTITPLGAFPLHVLTTNVVGNGSITKVPDYAAYSDSAQVELTAVADPGWLFAEWSDGISGITNPITITMRSDTLVTANFIELPFAITTNVVGGGSIELDPDLPGYASGDTVVVTAVPQSGWDFSAWSDGLSGSENPDTIVVEGDTTVTATFLQGAYTVDILIAGEGTVTVNPDKASYLPGDTIVLTALPDPNYYFYGWSDDHNGDANPDTITVDGDMSITATFFGEITGIDSPPIVKVLTVLQNSPNPFTRETYLDFGLPASSDVQIHVYDVAGRRVFTERIPEAREGWNRFLFRGHDVRGRELPSGVYFYRVQTREAVVTKKMVILR
ncbi:MAG: DUF1349 domain-containing protein [Candidatus Latescibacterota bacterium]|nr:MAG: DUF1349 domain-containing protein [Candidatus Latescibacterota bacterium]